jgi:hypothetical protein
MARFTSRDFDNLIDSSLLVVTDALRIYSI